MDKKQPPFRKEPSRVVTVDDKTESLGGDDIRQCLQRVFDKTSCFLFLMDPFGTLFEINRSALEYVGVPKEKILGRWFWDAPWWQSSPALLQRIELAVSAAAEGIPQRFEVQIGDGNALKWCDITLKLEEMESTGRSFIIAEAWDISERKRAESETVGCVIDNQDKEPRGFVGGIRDISEQRRREEGISNNLSEKEIVADILRNSLQPVSLAEILEQTLDLVLSRHDLRLESKGAIFLLERESGELVMMVSQGLDKNRVITCSRVPVGYCLCGRAAKSGKLVFADCLDERHETICTHTKPYGHYCAPIQSAGEVIGVLTLYVPEGYSCTEEENKFIATVADTLAGVIQRKQAEEALTKARNELEQKVKNRTISLQMANRRLEYEIGARREKAQELRKAKEMAEQASLHKSEFLACMSHEIRTPINGVLGMLELLQREPLEVRQQRFVDVAHDSANALLNVINDILDFSRIEAGKLEPKNIEFDLVSVVEDSASMLSKAASDNGLELVCFASSALPERGWGDPLRLGQVLSNLLSNAVKFTHQGEVVLWVEPEDGSDGANWIRFEVRDTGIGISEEQQKRLFDAFTQADHSTTRRYGGTGLGLSIVLQLVELMGGCIGMESHPGKGTRFWFTLDLGGGTQGQSKKAFSGERVLVIEDNASSRTVLKSYMSEWGLQVQTVGGTEHVLEYLEAAADRDEPYEMLLMGQGLRGDEDLVRLIRSTPALDELRLIVMGYLNELGNESRKDGVDGYLVKPVRYSKLHEIVNAMLFFDKVPLPYEKEVEVESWTECYRRGRVLLVEDHPVNQEVISEMLQLLGFDVELARDGLEGVDIFSKGGIDLVLMDYEMPELDGLGAAKAIREEERRQQQERVTIIALSAHAMSGYKEMCLAAGMDDYLTKPLKLEILARTLERWIPNVKLIDSEPREPEPDVFETLFDRAQLEQVRHVMGQKFPGVLEKFRANGEALLQILWKGERRADVESMRKAAHGLKGSSASLGCTYLSKLCKQLEEHIRQGNLTDVSCRIEQIEKEFRRTCTLLEMYEPE